MHLKILCGLLVLDISLQNAVAKPYTIILPQYSSQQKGAPAITPNVFKLNSQGHAYKRSSPGYQGNYVAVAGVPSGNNYEQPSPNIHLHFYHPTITIHNPAIVQLLKIQDPSASKKNPESSNVNNHQPVIEDVTSDSYGDKYGAPSGSHSNRGAASFPANYAYNDNSYTNSYAPFYSDNNGVPYSSIPFPPQTGNGNNVPFSSSYNSRDPFLPPAANTGDKNANNNLGSSLRSDYDYQEQIPISGSGPSFNSSFEYANTGDKNVNKNLRVFPAALASSGPASPAFNPSFNSSFNTTFNNGPNFSSQGSDLSDVSGFYAAPTTRATTTTNNFESSTNNISSNINNTKFKVYNVPSILSNTESPSLNSERTESTSLRPSIPPVTVESQSIHVKNTTPVLKNDTVTDQISTTVSPQNQTELTTTQFEDYYGYDYDDS